MEKRLSRQGMSLDYVLVSAKLRSLVKATRLSGVCRLGHTQQSSKTLHWREGQVPVLQLDRQMMQPQQCQPAEVLVMQENLSQDELSVQFAQFTAAQERAKAKR